MLSILKKWWFYEFIKKYGFKGYFAIKFAIKTPYHPFYVNAYNLGMEKTKERLNDIIFALKYEASSVSFDPPRTNREQQIAGFEKAFFDKFGMKWTLEGIYNKAPN